MTLKEIASIFQKELVHQYPIAEIESFINITFANLLGYNRAEQLLKANELISSESEIQIYNIIEQLKGFRPIQYILGSTEFYGFKFFVDETVLIPRPETEELVKWIYDDQSKSRPRIIDMGTGSGCIAVTLAALLPEARVWAVDVSDEALETAHTNALLNNVKVDFQNMDILSEFISDLGMFDVVVSNPPYVTHEQKNRMEPNVLDNEPHLALFVPDMDPLIFYKAIAKFAKKSLIPNGTLYFEINEDLAYETAAAVEQFGFKTELRKDINDKYRMLKAMIK